MPDESREPQAGSVRAEADCDLVSWNDDVRGVVEFRTTLSREITGSRDMSTGIAYLEPGGWLGEHRHDATEIYFIVDGTGRMRLNGTEYAVAEGDTVFVPGNCSHGIRNTGSSRLRWFYVFDVDSFDDVHYRYP